MKKRSQSAFCGQRRNFFKHTALLGAAVVIGATGKRPTARAQTLSLPADRQKAGYRLTPHVRRYYQRAAF